MKKRKLSKLGAVIIITAMLLQILPMAVQADGPIEISSAEDLYNVSNDLGGSYILTDDIVLTDYLAEGGAGYNEGAGWEPIGTSEAPFTGIFDGNGHVVTGLFINRPEADYIGLFGYMDQGAVVRNVTLENVDICGNGNVGGLVGYNNAGSITEASVTGSVSGNDYTVGGLVGWNKGTIDSSSTEAGMTGDGVVGGLVGRNDGTITECYATGNVGSNNDNAGGLVGFNYGGTIIRSYATGNVMGSAYDSFGGLVGGNSSAANITDSYATGAVTGPDCAGGLVGYNGTGNSVTNCYSTGAVSSEGEVGGLIGENSGDTTFCYFDNLTTGQNDTNGGASLSTIEMMDEASFESWDFSTVWTIQQGTTYPYLQWQSVGGDEGGSEVGSEGEGGSDGESVAADYAITNGTDEQSDKYVVKQGPATAGTYDNLTAALVACTDAGEDGVLTIKLGTDAGNPLVIPSESQYAFPSKNSLMSATFTGFLDIGEGATGALSEGLYIDSGEDVIFDGLTITHNVATQCGANATNPFGVVFVAGSLTMDGNSSIEDSAIYSAGVHLYNQGHLTVDDGTIRSTGQNSYAIRTVNTVIGMEGAVIINSGSISSTGENSIAISVEAESIIVNSGNIESATNYAIRMVETGAGDSTLSINGGSISSGSSSAIYLEGSGFDTVNTNSNEVVVAGGSIQSSGAGTIFIRKYTANDWGTGEVWWPNASVDIYGLKIHGSKDADIQISGTADAEGYSIKSGNKDDATADASNLSASRTFVAWTGDEAGNSIISTDNGATVGSLSADGNTEAYLKTGSQTDAEIAAAATALDVTDFTFGGSENEDSVTQNFSLPLSGDNDTIIGWSVTSGGSYASVNSETGEVTVTKPENGSGNAAVTLRATISKDGGTSVTKDFALTILESAGDGGSPDGVDTDAEGNTYNYLDNGDGTVTIRSFTRNGDTTAVVPEILDGLTVTRIADSSELNSVFYNKGLASVTLPDTITYIGRSAFGHNSLSSVTIPVNVTSIGRYAFAGQGNPKTRENALTEVIFAEGSKIETIGEGAFSENIITSVTLPQGLKTIGVEAFADNLLQSVIVPASVDSIGDGAFAGNQLTDVTIENAEATIGEGTFANNQEISANLTIHGYRGSTAETYAKAPENGHTFAVIEDDAPTYTVTYNGNGSTGGSVPTDGNSYAQGATVTVLGNTDSLVKSGYKFSGWNTTADGTGTSYTAGADFIMGDANVILYAKWTANASPAPSTEESGSPASQQDNGTGIVVNGDTYQNAAIIKTDKDTNGQIITTVTVDEQKLEQILNSIPGARPVVQLPVSADSNVIVGQLNGQMVKLMENKSAVLEIKTDNVTYTLPASQINIDNVSKLIGMQADLRDIKVTVKISASTEGTAKIMENTAKKDGCQLVVKPVDFEITCSSGVKTVEVTKFNGYVERTVAIPEGIDPGKITTGIVLNADGTFSHVPTTIIMIGGRYYAKINSLTNSTYSVIYHPVTFTDVANHWAKNAVNDMGSRLIIDGVGNGNIEPDRDITRGEFAEIVVRALGMMRNGTGHDTFDDVAKKDLYYDAVSIAKDNGVIDGYGNGRFVPSGKLTREQAMTIIARAMSFTKLKVDLSADETRNFLAAYSDSDKSADYAKAYIAECVKAGIVSGRENKTLAPKDSITRAEAATIVRNLLQKSKLIN